MGREEVWAEGEEVRMAGGNSEVPGGDDEVRQWVKKAWGMRRRGCGRRRMDGG